MGNFQIAPYKCFVLLIWDTALNNLSTIYIASLKKGPGSSCMFYDYLLWYLEIKKQNKTKQKDTFYDYLLWYLEM